MVGLVGLESFWQLKLVVSFGHFNCS